MAVAANADKYGKWSTPRLRKVVKRRGLDVSQVDEVGRTALLVALVQDDECFDLERDWEEHGSEPADLLPHLLDPRDDYALCTRVFAGDCHFAFTSLLNAWGIEEEDQKGDS